MSVRILSEMKETVLEALFLEKAEGSFRDVGSEGVAVSLVVLKVCSVKSYIK